MLRHAAACAAVTGSTCCAYLQHLICAAFVAVTSSGGAAHLEQLGLICVRPGVGTQARGLRSLLHVRGQRIGIRVDRDGGNAKPVACLDYAAGDLAAVGNQDSAIGSACGMGIASSTGRTEETAGSLLPRMAIKAL